MYVNSLFVFVCKSGLLENFYWLCKYLNYFKDFWLRVLNIILGEFRL